jgi:hypothetical protein
MLACVTWVAIAVHLVVGVVTVRRLGSVTLLPLLNLAVAICVVGYWVPRWYGTIARGATWYLSDQVAPGYAILAGALTLLTLTGRWPGGWAQWLIFAIDALVLLGAGLFFSFFRLNRLM